MTNRQAGDELDERVRRAAEAFTRLTNRRRFLAGALEGAFALFAGMALGSWRSAIALAADGGCKDCTYFEGHSCVYYGYACPSQASPGCPSGCSVCQLSSGQCTCVQPNPPHYQCCYSAGYWTVTGCGPCGYGTRYCTDCKCPDCNHACTCRSGCFCCNCCSPQDVAVEMLRLASARESPIPGMGSSPT